MALKNLKTDLKSLRYGKDRPGGGNSNQPYTTISAKDSFNISTEHLANTGGPDFTLRANTLQHVSKDNSRISKFLFSGKGAQFIAKQNLLSRTGVKTQASGFVNEGIYLPTSTISQVAANPFGGHLLKQGTNPFRNTSPNADPNNNSLLNLLGVGDNISNFLNKAGEVPVYSQIVKTNETPGNNRLVNLKNSKISINQPSSPTKFLDNLFGGNAGNILQSINPFRNKLGTIAKTLFTNNTKKYGISSFNDEILRYGGGPGSILGIGQTRIKRYYNTVTNGFSDSVDNGYFNVLSSGAGIDGRYIGNSGKEAITDFRAELNIDSRADRQNILSKSLDYADYNKRLEGRVNLGNPGKLNKNVSSYTKGLGALDKINALPLYKSNGPLSEYTNDLVKFRIGVIDNTDPSFKTYIHFRAFIDAFSDNYSAEWNGEKFMGRGEKFYRYGGFDRNINLSWTVAAQSREELMIQYKKLNYLASVLSPDYTNSGYMAGNLVTLTLGSWCYEQPGIITSLNLSVPQESPWEINISDGTGSTDNLKEMPHIVKVTGFNFIPIHNFVPKVQKNDVDSRGTNSYGKERYIALTNKSGNDYDNNPSAQVSRTGFKQLTRDELLKDTLQIAENQSQDTFGVNYV